MWILYPGQVENWSVGLCGGRKTGEPGATRSNPEQGGNQQQTQLRYDTEPKLNQGHISGS